MNRAEAIEFAKEQQEIFGGRMGEFLKFVEDELTQTTGDDLISRADVLAFAKDVTLKGGAKHRCIDATMIHELPSAERSDEAEYWHEKCQSYEQTIFKLSNALAERRGKWIKENIVLTSNPPQYQWHCSECGRIVHWFTKEVLTNYCPNCGAKMIIDKDDTQ